MLSDFRAESAIRDPLCVRCVLIYPPWKTVKPFSRRIINGAFKNSPRLFSHPQTMEIIPIFNHHQMEVVQEQWKTNTAEKLEYPSKAQKNYVHLLKSCSFSSKKCPLPGGRILIMEWRKEKQQPSTRFAAKTRQWYLSGDRKFNRLIVI